VLKATAFVHKGEIYTQDMAFLHVYIRDGSVPPVATTSSLCHKGEYTQGHGIPPYISEWDLGVLRFYQQLVPDRIYTQGHGIPPCISEWDLLIGITEKYTPGHGIPSMYISEWDLHGAA
jgi:hypothetical protein